MTQTLPIPCDTLITADILVTQDPQRRIISDAAVAITGGRVLYAGRRQDAAGYTPEKRLDLGRALLMPGLVNAHTHSSMTFLRGFADDLPLMEWLTKHIFPVEKHLNRDVVALGCLLGCAEMMRTGTTAFADMYLIEDAVAETVVDCGMKVLMGEAVFTFPSPTYNDWKEALALLREQAARRRDSAQVRVSLMPHAVYTTTPEILIACRELADELNLPLYIHLAESAEETKNSLHSFGRRPVAYCRDLGILTENTTIAHGVDLDDEEIAFLAEAGVRVAHNPKSNMKLASGVARIPAMLQRGMLPGIGTDGAASNNSLNMFSEMSACALLHKVTGMDPTLLPAQTVLDMATLGSAKALGWSELGSLVAGGPADMIALDLTSPNLLPLFHPVSHLVYAASGFEVNFTMVNGRILYHNGEYKTIDYPYLLKEAARLKEWTLAAASGTTP